ncbi:MAG: hypothetical protein IM606_14035 [Cytophagales bacterium]|jgi:hypothetical protein|nr:hypothetical protein [Cytophagales bacterium]MCA6389175.1 hypothetical protein [Cytophagales bacterium]MCA6390324.1 hypothetical protein [Cytophagales bacterium]MCA6396299.1 hypothetical protein [Cytophagales bacterium]MCA6402229.1 hypothetical protein [Cytophagales bacterium]
MIFLRLKHWQYSGLWIIPQILIQVIPTKIEFWFVLIFTLLNCCLLLGWIWAVSFLLGLSRQSFARTIFSICFGGAMLYLPYFLISNVSYNLSQIGIGWMLEDWIQFSIHIVFIAALLYCVFFSAMIIQISQVGSTVDLGKIIGIALCILVFPIGIWFIQGRVNKLAAEPQDR